MLILMKRRKEAYKMKKLLTASLTATLLLSGISTTTASAKTISGSELRKYKPLKAYDYQYRETHKNGKIFTYRTTYKYEQWTPNVDQQYVAPLSYHTQKNSLYIVAYQEWPLLGINAPVKKGNISYMSDMEDNYRYKVLSTSKKLKVANVTYKNVIVVKETKYKTKWYLAKNRGIVLSKGQSGRTELIKVYK